MKTKKILRKLIFSLVLALSLGLGTAAVGSFADTGTWTDNNNVKYNYDTGTKKASVAKQVINLDLTNAPNGNITIRDNININGTTYAVKSIDNEAFMRCRQLTGITIPEGVESI